MVQALPPTAPDRKSNPAQHAPTPGDEDDAQSPRDSSREFMYWKNEALSPLSEGSKILSEGLPAKQVHTHTHTHSGRVATIVFVGFFFFF